MLAYSCAISSCVHKYAFVCSVLGYPGILFGDSPDARDSVQPTAIFSKVKLNIKNQWESCRESGRSSMSICETQKKNRTKSHRISYRFSVCFFFVLFLFSVEFRMTLSFKILQVRPKNEMSLNISAGFLFIVLLWPPAENVAGTADAFRSDSN